MFAKKFLSIALLAAIFLMGATAHAATYTGEGAYVMNAGENLGVAKERAKVAALRDATEKAFPYVKAYALAKNVSLDSDSVELITVNVIKLADEPRFNIDNPIINVTVAAQIENSDIDRLLGMELYESIIQYKALRRGEDKQAKLIASPDADKIFLSHQKLHEALKLYNIGDYEGTIRLCNEAIELNPTYNFSYNNRALALIGLGQYDRAIEDFGTSIQLHPACFNAYNNRGAVYRHLNRYDKAIDDHNNAIRIKPTSEDSYFNRGLDYYCLGDYERAVADFNKALELNPNYKPAEKYREACLKAMGK